MKEHQHIEWKSSWQDEYLKWLKENGYIDRIGSRKGGHWEVLK